MKNLAVVLLMAGFVSFGLSSCKKDWTCTCTTTVLGQTSTSTVTLKDLKKSEAEDACEGYQVSAGGVSASCELDD